MAATTYSFKSIVGAFNDPDVGPFLFAGQQGVKQITITYTTDRTAQDVAADGSTMISYISAMNGSVSIETQQTSTLHQFLVNWANAKFVNAETGNATEFAGASIKIQDLISGATHLITGVSPTKIPDKTYGPQGGSVTWVLMAGQVVTQ